MSTGLFYVLFYSSFMLGTMCGSIRQVTSNNASCLSQERLSTRDVHVHACGYWGITVFFSKCRYFYNVILMLRSHLAGHEIEPFSYKNTVACVLFAG